jgi:exopolysaccharide production protein ExoY
MAPCQSPNPTNMPTVNASPNQIVPIEELFSSNPEVWPVSTPLAGSSKSEPLIGDSGKTDNCSSHVCGDERESFAEASYGGSKIIPLWKRVLDVTCVLLSVPVWFPLFVLIALWVKLVSPGSIFFRQERVGYRGSRFMLLKFRTMKVNVETQSHEKHLEQLIHGNAPMTKLDASGDPRIIAGGRILRAMGLDELPQLFNVLRGEMSLVGPRPSTAFEFGRFKGWQQERVNALPGLTGYWQVNGKNKTTFTAMIQMDIWYTKNLSPLLDLAIMFKTIPAIIVQVLEARTPVRVPADRRRGVIALGTYENNAVTQSQSIPHSNRS